MKALIISADNYEPDWAWALYLTKGAVGVGQKRGRAFLSVGGVCDNTRKG